MRAMTLRRRILECERCPRLLEHCRAIAATKRRAYRDETYWGRPVPSFGRLDARLWVVGLAPGAHGANRTGRIFTGDSSGDWLYRALHHAGFANQPESTGRRDGLRLIDARITGAARCAPPDNKPTAAELAACRPFLVEELAAARRMRVVILLGRVALDAFWKAWPEAGGSAFARKPGFGHGLTHEHDGLTLITSYHPSRQNTQTGRLTRPMFHRVFREARKIVSR